MTSSELPTPVKPNSQSAFPNAPPEGGAVPARPLPTALALSVLAGFLLILSFPYARIWPLSFVALVPFFESVRGQKSGRGLLLGFLLGFVLQAYLMFWANFFGAPAFLFLAIYRAYPYAFAGWAWSRLSTAAGPLRVIGCVSAWVFVEFYQTWGPFGTTWGMLSHALARQTSLLQICSLGGPWLLSAVIALVNLGFVEALRRRWKTLPLALLILAVTYGYGHRRLEGAPRAHDGGSLKVAAIQVNMGREIKWDPHFAEVALERLQELTLKAAQRGAKVVIWPETSIPYRNFRRSPQLTFRVGMLARQAQSWLVVGSIEMMGDAGNHTLNTASLVSPEGGYDARYDKQRLVPGGEYLPFESLLRPFRIFDRVMNYLPGTGNGLLECTFPRSPQDDLRLGMMICFESMVPWISVERARAGAQALAVGTNDGWFGDNSAIAHHFEMAIFRAVECGRPMIQSGNTGISGVIDSYGRVLCETQANIPDFALSSLRPESELTLYVRWGDYVPWLAGLIAALCLGFCSWSQGGRRERPKAPN